MRAIFTGALFWGAAQRCTRVSRLATLAAFAALWTPAFGRQGSSEVEQGTHKPLVGSSILPPGTPRPPSTGVGLTSMPSSCGGLKVQAATAVSVVWFPQTRRFLARGVKTSNLRGWGLSCGPRLALSCFWQQFCAGLARLVLSSDQRCVFPF